MTAIDPRLLTVLRGMGMPRNIVTFERLPSWFVGAFAPQMNDQILAFARSFDGGCKSLLVDNKTSEVKISSTAANKPYEVVGSRRRFSLLTNSGARDFDRHDVDGLFMRWNLCLKYDVGRMTQALIGFIKP